MGELAEDYIRDTSGREPSPLLATLLSDAILDILEKREVFAAVIYEELMLLAPSVIAGLPEEAQAKCQATMVPYDELAEEVKDRMRALADQLSAKAMEMAGEEGMDE
jgi:hypothetical protein